MIRSQLYAIAFAAAFTTVATAGDFEEPIVPITMESEDVWAFEFRPYLWTASIEGDARLGNLPTADVDIGFDDILDWLDMTWASTFNVEHRPSGISFFIDTFYLRMTPEVDTAAGPVDIRSVTIKQAIINPTLAYRVWDQPERLNYLDLTAGVAWTYMSLDFRAKNTATGEDIGPDDSVDWFDLHVGARARYSLTEKLYTGLLFDISPFQTGADFGLQIATGLGYRITPWWSAEFMYRYLHIDYDEDKFLYDTDTHGLFLGSVFSW